MPGDATSTEKEPIFEMLDEGTYTIQLIAIGDGGADTTEQTVTVGVSKEFRAFGYGAKTWHLHSLKLNGNETANNSCYWDNTMVVDRQDLTFNYLEGQSSCPNASIPEQRGTFTYNTDFTEIYLSITDPFVGTATYTINYLTHDTLRMSASLTSFDAEFLVTTTPRTK